MKMSPSSTIPALAPAPRSLALTFDDGPDPVWTPRLLDLLSDLGAAATFFVIAPCAAAHPELIDRITREGHTIGVHCDRHVRHSRRGIDWGRADAAHALELLDGVGVRPSWWRTPWGDLAPWSAQVAAEQGLELIGWTVDTHDWRGDSAERMFAASAAGLHSGAIVLAHDGIGPGARRDDASETLRLISLVAAHAARANLSLDALVSLDAIADTARVPG
jgi:peptidoglycan-N-acetylglucosamine deacetylase